MHIDRPTPRPQTPRPLSEPMPARPLGPRQAIDPVLAAVVSELIATATLVAATASFVFAKVSGAALTYNGPVGLILPRPPHIFPAVARALIDWPDEPQLKASIASFHETVILVARATSNEASKPAPNWASLGGAWRGASQKAFAALRHARLSTRFDDQTDQTLATLTETMKTLRVGQPSNIARDGFFYLPDVLDRRAEPRVRRSDPAIVETARGKTRTHLVDASRHGFGLGTLIDATRGEILTVIVDDREPMTAIVMWLSQGGTGVRLIHPLSPADPLLRHSRMRQPS
jgi:hypothetical protein